MQGRRAPDDSSISELYPGDYCLWTSGEENDNAPWQWVVCTPDGRTFGLAMPHMPDKNGQHHRVEVHEDRTISVMPPGNSILSPGGWHGYLDHGVWVEAE